MDAKERANLRRHINEGTRVELGGATPIRYIGPDSVVEDIKSRRNHAIFGRRGSGKTLLLRHAASDLSSGPIRAIYVNLESFKNHSYPNVLVEILDAVFSGLDPLLSGWLFPKRRRSKKIIDGIRQRLYGIKNAADETQKDVRSLTGSGLTSSSKTSFGASVGDVKATADDDLATHEKREREERFKESASKINDLDLLLPELKKEIATIFKTRSIHAVLIEFDDFYFLKRADQPLVADYIHRLCKDTPLFYKVATLRHASTLYADRLGQPFGMQERHDYQAIDVEFSLSEFSETAARNRSILLEFGKRAAIAEADIDRLFEGDGFNRLVLAAGGVPRDFLSQFLDIMEDVHSPGRDGKIGKDDVRAHSQKNFLRRIEELKKDSEEADQSALIRGIYMIISFCVTEKKTNIFFVARELLQHNDKVSTLLYRLLDYRIIHSVGKSLTHKSQQGTFEAFSIDIGSYAHMRVLNNKFSEIDLSHADARENMRSAPILDQAAFEELWRTVPPAGEAEVKINAGIA